MEHGLSSEPDPPVHSSATTMTMLSRFLPSQFTQLKVFLLSTLI